VIVGKVIGTVWATKKQTNLQGLRFLLVEPFIVEKGGKPAPVVAADPVGAGIGETVIVAFGRAARNAIGRGHTITYQTAVVGIVDYLELEDGRVFLP
jgi:ethanolamine utilization protein EutN